MATAAQPPHARQSERSSGAGALRFALAYRGEPKDYLVAVASVASAAAISKSLNLDLNGAVTPLFLTAVATTTWFGGFWPGLLAIGLSALSIVRIRAGEPVGDVLVLLLFTLCALLISALNALRRHSSQSVQREQENLETSVEQRTSDLSAANRRLQGEVTERVRAEESLKESEERFRALFEDAPVAYHEIDRDGVIRRVNRAECELLERQPEELIGHPVWELVSPQARDASHREVLLKTSGQKLLQPFTREFTTKTGKSVFVEIRERYIRDRNGDIIGLRSTLLDVTARLQAEESIKLLNADLERRVRERTIELERSNEALQQFAYSASHDLQEPLRMVASYVQLLKRRIGANLDEDTTEYMFYITDGADRMSRLIRDLLAFSRAGNVTDEEPEEIDMQAVVQVALRNLQGAIEDSGAIVTATALPKVHARAAGLSQVIQNLLSNSIKYRTEAPPDIHITCDEQPDHWLFCVRDNGLGFDQSKAERAFGIFKRLHGREYPGTGIGLAICKRIVERSGGKIWAESTEGAGSRFYFTLPKQPAFMPISKEHPMESALQTQSR